MTRSNAAQEPSMDEILASIRRIIENGEEGAAAAGQPRVRPERTPLVERLDAPAGGSSNLVARLTPDAEARLADAETAVDLSGSIFSSDDEDDLAARLQREIEADGLIDESFFPGPLVGFDDLAEGETGALSDAMLSVPVVEPVEDEDRIGRSDPSEFVAVETAPKVASQETGWNQVFEPWDASVEPAAAALEETPAAVSADALAQPFVAANSDSRRMQDFRSAVLDDHAEPRTQAAAPLVSGRTGDLVGASFDELAAAIREGELRSLESMAEDMLRPMLREWLDDNLPKMVECLVREEIERVARGGRR